MKIFKRHLHLFSPLYTFYHSVTLFRTRLNGHQQFDRIKHVRYTIVPRTTLADQVVLLAHTAREALHKYKFRRAGVQRDIIAVDPDVAVHRVRLQQVSARHESGPRLPVHVRRVPHIGVADRAQRILHGKSPHLPKDGEMIEETRTMTRS